MNRNLDILEYLFSRGIFQNYEYYHAFGILSDIPNNNRISLTEFQLIGLNYNLDKGFKIETIMVIEGSNMPNWLPWIDNAIIKVDLYTEHSKSNGSYIFRTEDKSNIYTIHKCPLDIELYIHETMFGFTIKIIELNPKVTLLNGNYYIKHRSWYGSFLCLEYN